MAKRAISMPRTSYKLIRVWLPLCALCVSAVNVLGSDFADAIVEYRPAPGQFVNNPLFNDPAAALGAPVGNGAADPSNDKVVTLGGFGGSITLRFGQTVMDDPCNPWGLDAIVYGNAFWAGGDASRRFAEGGIIEISRDVNGNGIADDPWYVVRAQVMPAVPATVLQSQSWDNSAGTPTPPANTSWYPAPPWFVGWPSSYVTQAYRLPPALEVSVLVNPGGPGATAEAYWGLADLSPTMVLGDLDGGGLVDDPLMSPSDFYTSPDNPFEVGITPGTGGGDAFDIAWAVDAQTGAAAGLEGFDFIRISTGANRVDFMLGEMSTEVGGVARVRARPGFFDLTGDGVADVEDLYAFEAAAVDLTGEGVADDRDRRLLCRCIRRGEVGDTGWRP